MKFWVSLRDWFRPAAQRHERAHQAGQRYGQLIVAAKDQHPLAHLALIMHLRKQQDLPRSARAEAEWQAYHRGVHHVLGGAQHGDAP
jgi:hypothetical protein